MVHIYQDDHAVFRLHDFHAIERTAVQVERQDKGLLIGNQVLFRHLTTCHYRHQVRVVHLDDVVTLRLEMDVEGRMRRD